jgi:hypothetical protein
MGDILGAPAPTRHANTARAGDPTALTPPHPIPPDNQPGTRARGGWRCQNLSARYPPLYIQISSR